MIHHDFEMSPEAFEAEKAWPIKGTRDWKGAFASQSPLNRMHVVADGRGANGTAGYLALVGEASDQFYAEATPRWHRPREALDLRDTRASVSLKAITPIRVNAGYTPHLFVADYDEATHTYCGWRHRQVLEVGDEWTLNTIELADDETRWSFRDRSVTVQGHRPLGAVLSRVGFIGIIYHRDGAHTGVGATGVLGIDEFCYGMPVRSTAF